MKTFRWKVKPGMMASGPFRRKMPLVMAIPSEHLRAGCRPENVQRDAFCFPVGSHGAGVVSWLTRGLESLSVDARL